MAEIKCPQCGTIISLEQSDLDSVVKQVRDEEFRREVEERAQLLEAEKESAVQLAQTQTRAQMQEALSAKDAEIVQLKSQISSVEETHRAQQELAVTQAVAAVEKERDQLSTALKLKESEQAQAEAAFKEQLAEQLRMKDDVIAYHKEELERVKEMKAQLSTKMVGESLEQHCQYEFDRIRAVAFPNAYFEKDNEAVEGTKGDFIFREEDGEGNEIISIMFEMKNLEDTTSRKKRNEEHFAKLDKDRTKKGCEYAILVSLLEPDSELYNEGIVDVSHRYPKMYVIRPQFFIPIISLLRNAALSSLEYKQELAIVRQQNLDITHFEDDLNKFKDGFFSNFEKASARFDDTIKAIDKAIEDLEKAKKNLLTSEKHLSAANNKLDGLTVKKLVRKNPTMKEKFAALEEADD